MYATLSATFATAAATASSTSTSTSSTSSSDSSILLKYLPNIPGMHFLIGSMFCFIGWLLSIYGFNNANKNHPALITTTTATNSDYD